MRIKIEVDDKFETTVSFSEIDPIPDFQTKVHLDSDSRTVARLMAICQFGATQSQWQNTVICSINDLDLLRDRWPEKSVEPFFSDK